MNFECKKNKKSYLKWLESESIYIMREVIAECNKPVLLFSGGKDSIVLLRIAEKAFRPNKFPFSILHIDTGYNFPEVLSFRDQMALKLNENIIVRKINDSIKKGTININNNINNFRNIAQATTLLETINEFKFDACIGGARRDEEKSRAKERIFSFRDKFGQWNPKYQRPELWDLYNTKVNLGENIRIFPLSNWTELDVWQYIYYEKLSIPSIYFSHKRPVILYNKLLIPYFKNLTKNFNNKKIKKLIVRFRTVGDIFCTCPVISNTRTVKDIIKEISITEITERGLTRLDDKISENSMEIRKKEGYF